MIPVNERDSFTLSFHHHSSIFTLPPKILQEVCKSTVSRGVAGQEVQESGSPSHDYSDL